MFAIPSQYILAKGLYTEKMYIVGRSLYPVSYPHSPSKHLTAEIQQ